MISEMKVKINHMFAKIGSFIRKDTSCSKFLDISRIVVVCISCLPREAVHRVEFAHCSVVYVIVL